MERKQLAVQMLAEWNRNTADHRAAIDLAYPGQLDDTHPSQGGGPRLDEAEAKRLHDAGTQNPDDIQVRGHVMQLLNYCEYVAVAAQQGAADPQVVAGSFEGALHRIS